MVFVTKQKKIHRPANASPDPTLRTICLKQGHFWIVLIMTAFGVVKGLL